jgi:hypothetical protein
MTDISKNSAIRNAQGALEPGEEIQCVFLAMAVSDRAALIEEIKRRRAGEEPVELPLGSRYDRFAIMASDRNLYVIPQTGQVQHGIAAAAKILATGNFTPLDVSAAEKHPLGSILVTREGKRLHVGDLELKVVRMNRKDAEALVAFVEERAPAMA